MNALSARISGLEIDAAHNIPSASVERLEEVDGIEVVQGQQGGFDELAMNAGAGLSTIAKTIHPYPTQAEAIKKAADAYSRTRLTPTVKSVFDKLLSWRR